MSEPTYFYIPQRDKEWHALHFGRPTASGFGEIMTTKFELREGASVRTYMYKRLAEKLTGHGLPGFSSAPMEQGTLLEDDAVRRFEYLTGKHVESVGFILSADERCGCSPDGLVGDDSGLELKCPNIETHLKYLDAGVLPSEYSAQVHGSMFVSGRSSWHFMSYARGMRPFRIEVKRDEEICKKIGDCLAKFYAMFDAALERLK